jgi:hypothetical protein
VWEWVHSVKLPAPSFVIFWLTYSIWKELASSECLVLCKCPHPHHGEAYIILHFSQHTTTSFEVAHDLIAMVLAFQELRGAERGDVFNKL